MSQIILVRHGQTAHNKERRLQGQLDTPLDELGQQQAQKLAALLARLKVQNPSIHSSDLRRAFATAQAIQTEVGGALISTRELREIDMGDWEGQRFADVAASDGPLHDRFWRGDPHCCAPNGETPAEVGQRVYTHTLDSWPKTDETLIIVSHGIAITSLLCRLLNLDYQTEFASGRMQHHNTAYSWLKVEPSTRAVITSQLALAPHLDGLTCSTA